MPRIVSLIASATEMVYALGCGEQLVGRSHECDYPPAVHGLPVCTASRLAVQASSAAIDRQVKALLAQGEPLYAVDSELLAQLRPDVVLTQSQCAVCAVSPRDLEPYLGEKCAPRLVALSATTLAGVWQDVLTVAEALGVRERGQELVRRLQQRVAVIAAQTAQLPRPSVVCLEWLEPLLAAGHWVPELVALAGGQDRFGVPGQKGPTLHWEQLRSADPEVLLILPCGWDQKRSRAEMPALTERPGWEQLRAVRNRRVYLMDGNQYFNRPGPRLVESLEILAEVLHPGVFDFGHRGRGWEAF
jgi:iron complex transport system substrate-binding protein